MMRPVYVVKGKRGTLVDLCGYFRVVTHAVARERINRHGWTPEKAVTTPPGKQVKKGFTYTTQSN
jgi:hypothetical protein